MQGATAVSEHPGTSHQNFNPRAPCRARRVPLFVRNGRVLFQSTRPVQGATKSGSPPCYTDSISIHAPRAGRDLLPVFAQAMQGISIHAPRAGRDENFTSFMQWTYARNFNPRAPCRARRGARYFDLFKERFQSTRPVQGATRRSCITTSAQRYFNPRAPCRARRWWNLPVSASKLFQSTRPVQGATKLKGKPRSSNPYFNPRAPCRARQIDMCAWGYAQSISIHAPRAGRDSGPVQTT